MALYAIKPWFQGRLGGVAKQMIAARVSPDALTLGAVGVAAVGGLALALGGLHPAWLLLVPPLALLRLALNALDGMVARAVGGSRFGEVLNEVGDRLADSAFLLGAALAPGADLRVGLLALALVLLSSFIGLAGLAAGGTRHYGGPMGKADRMLVLSVAAVATWAWPATAPAGVMTLALATIGVGALVTAGWRLAGIWRELRPA